MQVHLRGGTLPVAPQLVLGRGVASCPDDPYLSRQTCVLAYDQATGTASLTWMGRQCGALCSRQVRLQPMPNAHCPLPNARCPMPNAYYLLLSAQCAMPNALGRSRWALPTLAAALCRRRC